MSDRISVGSGATPSDDELVAIVAAVDAMWPKPVAARREQPVSRSTSWRFSGRWWVRPLPTRRDRPYR